MNLLLENGWIFEPTIYRQRQQLLIREAVPEEKRHPGGELDVADPVGLAVFQPGRLTLHAKQKFGIDEDLLGGCLNASLEAPSHFPSRTEESQKGLEIAIGYRTT